MKDFFVRWLLNGLGLVVAVAVVPGIRSSGWKTTAVAALVLGLLNTFIKPLLTLLTLPVNVLTLGLFTLVINGFLFYCTAWLVKGFFVDGFWHAFFGALVFSITVGLLNLLFNPERS